MTHNSYTEVWGDDSANERLLCNSEDLSLDGPEGH